MAFESVTVILRTHRAFKVVAYVGGKKVHLNLQQTKLLERLAMARPGENVPHLELLEYLYPDPDREPTDALGLVKVNISGLRSKGIVVKLNWGRGYQLV